MSDIEQIGVRKNEGVWSVGEWKKIISYKVSEVQCPLSVYVPWKPFVNTKNLYLEANSQPI